MFWFVAYHVKINEPYLLSKVNLKMMVREPSLPYLLKASDIKPILNSSYETSQCSDMYHKFVPWLFFTSYKWFSEVFMPHSFFQLIRFINLPFKIKTMHWSQPSLHCTASSWEMKWKYSLVINRWTAYSFHWNNNGRKSCQPDYHLWRCTSCTSALKMMKIDIFTLALPSVQALIIWCFTVVNKML